MIPFAPGFFSSSQALNLPAGLLLWFDPSDATKRVITSGRFESITCKVTSTVWSQSTADSRPRYDDVDGILKLPCMDFGATLNTRFLTGSAISLPIPFEFFMPVFFDGPSALFRSAGLCSNTATNNIQTGSAAPALFMYRATGGFDRNMQIYGKPPASPAYAEAVCQTTPDLSVINVRVPSTTPSATVVEENGTNRTTTFAGSAYLSTFSPVMLGASDTLYRTGETRIGEVMVWNRVLNSTERAAVYGYLNSRWIP